MPQLYYDEKNIVRAPQASDYSSSCFDYQYNQYIDLLYYYGYCKSKGLSIDITIKRQILHAKNVLLLRLTELEVSVGYSAVDHLVEMFDENQVTGWMKNFERRIEPNGELFLIPKE